MKINTDELIYILHVTWGGGGAWLQITSALSHWYMRCMRYRLVGMFSPGSGKTMFLVYNANPCCLNNMLYA